MIFGASAEITGLSCFYGVQESSIVIQLSEYLFITGTCNPKDLENYPIAPHLKRFCFVRDVNFERLCLTSVQKNVPRLICEVAISESSISISAFTSSSNVVSLFGQLPKYLKCDTSSVLPSLIVIGIGFMFILPTVINLNFLMFLPHALYPAVFASPPNFLKWWQYHLRLL